MLPIHGNHIIDDPFDPQKTVPALKNRPALSQPPKKKA